MSEFPGIYSLVLHTDKTTFMHKSELLYNRNVNFMYGSFSQRLPNKEKCNFLHRTFLKKMNLCINKNDILIKKMANFVEAFSELPAKKNFTYIRSKLLMVDEVNFQTHILYLNIFLWDIIYTTISKMIRKIGGGTQRI
jgi:hypothetical protein